MVVAVVLFIRYVSCCSYYMSAVAPDPLSLSRWPLYAGGHCMHKLQIELRQRRLQRVIVLNQRRLLNQRKPERRKASPKPSHPKGGRCQKQDKRYRAFRSFSLSSRLFLAPCLSLSLSLPACLSFSLFFLVSLSLSLNACQRLATRVVQVNEREIRVLRNLKFDQNLKKLQEELQVGGVGSGRVYKWP